MTDGQISHARLSYNAEGTPVSEQFDDVYFSNENGLAETRYVFIEHNQLPERWPEHTNPWFHVIETGFGTGLNFLVCWQAFRDYRQQHPAAVCQRLYFSTFEKFPLSQHDLTQALQHWPELAELSAQLLAQYPLPLAGCQRLVFEQGAVTLDLWLGDVADHLPQLPAANLADAWFLDGFAPSKNPEMWQDGLFSGMARLSQPGTTVATFTSAGLVRRGLQSAGFTVRKTKGFGRKREMAVGIMPAPAGHDVVSRARHATTAERRSATDAGLIIVGGGLASVCMATALIRRGKRVTLLSKDPAIAQGASHNRQGALYPQLQRTLSPVSRLHAKAYAFAGRYYRQQLSLYDFAHQFCGVLTLACNAQLAARQQAIAAEPGWPQGLFQVLDAAGCTKVAGLELPYTGLFYPSGGWVAPQDFCQATISWLQQQPNFTLLTEFNVRQVMPVNTDPINTGPVNSGWQVEGDAGIVQCEQLILCTGAELAGLPVTADLPVNQVRGQVSHVRCDGLSTLKTVLCHQGYITPADVDRFPAEHCVGATFDRERKDCVLLPEDDIANLALVNQVLQSPDWFNDAQVLSAKAGLRATVPDHLPLCGELQTDLFVLGGLGARGLLFAPLLAEQLACEICKEPAPLSAGLRALVHARRFERP